MDLSRLIKVAKAQNAHVVCLWIHANGQLMWAGHWYVGAKTLTRTTDNKSFVSFKRSLSKAKVDWDQMQFAIKRYHWTIATVSTRPTAGQRERETGLMYVTPVGVRTARNAS